MPCKKIGWVVSRLGPDQLCYDIIRSSNEYLQSKDDVDISLFWIQDGPRIIQPRFACMSLYELYGYPGVTIATSLHTLSRALDYPGPNRHSKIYFYDYNLDYLRLPQQMRNWEQLNTLYCHPKVEVIVRSEDHANIIKSVFRSVVGIVPDANIEKIRDIIYGKENS